MTYLRECCRIGRRAIVVNWVSFLHTRIDQYLVYRVLGSGALGLYGVAVSLAEMLSRIPGVLGMVAFSVVASGREGSNPVAATLRRTGVVMGAVSVIASVVFPLAPAIVDALYGEEYIGAGSILRLLLPAIVFLSGSLMLNNHAAGMGYPRFLVASVVVALTVNVGMNFALLPRVGVGGAAIASGASYCLQCLLIMVYLRASGARREGGLGVAGSAQPSSGASCRHDAAAGARE